MIDAGMHRDGGSRARSDAPQQADL